MLLLSFNIKDDKYAIDTRDVIEIVTLVRLKSLAVSIKGIAGLLNYHGESIPVIDVSDLCDSPIRERTLTTRIIIIKYRNNYKLGIKAENVTETIQVDKDVFKESGISVSQTPFLGEVAEIDNKFIQLIKVDQLLSDDIRQCLFTEISSAAG